jgi:hypothetical protein
MVGSGNYTSRNPAPGGTCAGLREISITLKTTRETVVASYCGLLWAFKIRRTAAMVFQFRVVAGTP